MKATAQTRKAADFVDVRRNSEGGWTYKCLKCGLTKEDNVYFDGDHKSMMAHAAKCKGKGAIKSPSGLTITRDVQLYGGGKALKHMAWRIKNCVPGGDRLQDHEAMSLAQVSLATGLDPFIGEVWYIPGKGPMAGIKGLRRRAKEQSTYSVDFRAMSAVELEDHNVKSGDVGRICELFRHDVLQKAVEINRAAGEPVIPVKPLLGVGIWQQGNQVASTKSKTWMANKRAEADALRQGFDLSELPYSDEINGAQLEVADVDAAGWSMVSEEDEAMRREVAHNAERRAQADDASAAPDFNGVVAKCADDAPADLDLDGMVAKYKNGELQLPPWVEEIREAVEDHPQASDSIGPGNGTFVTQLTVSAGRKVTTEQFRAFVQIVLTHPLDEVTFGEAACLMDAINADDFEAKVVSLQV